MTLKTTWFELDSKKTDLENFITFLKELPNTFQQVFSTDTSNFSDIINRDKEAGISFELFSSAYESATTTFSTSVNEFENRFQYEKIEATNILSNIGFVEDSLKLKIALLNKLWTRLVNATEITGVLSVNYWVKKIMDALKKLLKYLNSLLGSLSSIISGLDPLKELKEVVENYVDDVLENE